MVYRAANNTRVARPGRFDVSLCTWAPEKPRSPQACLFSASKTRHIGGVRSERGGLHRLNAAEA